MTDRAQVSIIIPVYNASQFLEEAVASALALDEVGEVILVEDGSKDNSLKICQDLQQAFPRVRLLRHEKGMNKGEAASRNLGIKNARFDLIAFLDADDWYCPNRFSRDIPIFEDNRDVKVTYSFSTINHPNGNITPYGEKIDVLKLLGSEVSLEDFYKYVISNDLVLGHVNTNTICKEIFENGDFFDERLKMHTDTEFWWRINRKYKFHASELEKPVSAARRHDNNTIYQQSIQTKVIMLLVWIDNIGLKELKDFEEKVVIYQLARALSNPIKNHFLRKSVLHSFQIFVNLIRPIFILFFYRLGMSKYKLYK